MKILFVFTNSIKFFTLITIISLKDLVKQAVPFLEVFNREEIVEAGHRYKEEIFKLK